MKVVFIHGLPAVGKLTVARKLAALTGLPLFHNHLTVDLVRSVFEFGSPDFVELRERIWLDVFRAAAADHRSLIFTFSPDATVRPGFPAACTGIIEGAGGSVLFVALVCSEASLEHRMESPSRSEFGKLRSTDLYRRSRAEGAFVFPELPADLRIDTDEVAPAEAAGLIAPHIG